MVIIMQNGVTEEQIEQVVQRTHAAGLKTQTNVGEQCTVIAVIGDKTALSDTPIESMAGVARTMPISAPYKLASRQFHEENTVISVNGAKIGGKQLAMMAGPCAVENTEQIVRIAKHVVKSGAQFIRGGAFKPRTGPYSFQGYGEPALKMLATAREETGLRVVTEVMTPQEVGLVGKYADVFQLGTRNMQNFPLLREVGRHGKPVILKRGLSSTIEEWLLAAEYILSEGNPDVILCERGIRTYETHTRNTLDLNAVPAVKELSHLPIIVDPSHGTGIRSYVPAMAKAAVAAGADGLIVEVHHDPDNSMTGDGVQSLFPDQFNQLMQSLRQIATAVDREI
ncbi:TPA: 3-deoxy-7-phosphoheptulonate synthase [Candidatus Poribacteria bacterium]|nr:3-deoxy-7-phosphoheptulonate synthase [Candidatus Poribacteria bacterium]HIO50673.1 3-deoxy-7-phosphoheptulonate synthase [Candidatus Poribacteria bacterium]